jgi:hypothetical protein
VRRQFHDLRRLRRGEFVKAKILHALLFFCASAGYAFGQVDCLTSTKLICQFPISAEILSADTFGQVYFSKAGNVAGPINASIATQLAQLPIPSATVGVVFIQKKGSDVPTTFENLGPVLTDRPDTVGRHHLFLGFSFQHFNFNSADGVSLNSLPVSFSFTQPSGFDPTDVQTFYASETNNINFKLNQYVGVLTFGLSKTTDVSVIVPVNSVNLAVKTSNFQAFYFDESSSAYTNESPGASTSVSTTGTASGIGDVTVSVKQLLIGGQGRPAVAAGASFRFPSGDALNYLGSGAVGGNAYGLFEYRRRLAPHLKLGYQWNGVSQVVNIQTAPSTRLPGGLQYAAGADFKIVHSLTAAFDLLGNQFANTPSFSLTNAPLCPTSKTGACIAPQSGSGINPDFITQTNFANTYSTANISAGLKWAPWQHLLFYGNVLKQVNNVGLRSDLVPLFGVAFKK